eukprot:CAMPEP_0116853078 /NCGR_PEP_ID=MMETSP0418-20121206/17688_1 /TAXON_ID=1158023 /ORGANISM="Astrosyne radiata, Strain 13vi08-1A" /LENGTH=379 /DNA_ID=CAMNT_0004485391 /DNA_START=14 /DNA_END=1153 /DNA_ORIENTATION=+
MGTLVFAMLQIADRLVPTRVFGVCSLFGATMNALIPAWPHRGVLILLRFLTGFSLAGIYPVGMKVASDWYRDGLGRALGWLVGALAVGSAFPFLLQQIPQSYRALLWETSALACMGGLLVGGLIPNGPHTTTTRDNNKKQQRPSFDPRVIWKLFSDSRAFRGAAFGYFGHMWELYAFWTWCPVVWRAYLEEERSLESSFWDENVITFTILAMGGLGCVFGGLASVRWGSAVVAFASLSLSGLQCLLSPLYFRYTPPVVMLISYWIWGLTVVADSPQFSSLVAQTAPAENKGTALTIVNCIGFSITIASIELLGIPLGEAYLFLLLAPGPLFGLVSMRHHVFLSTSSSSAEKKNQDDDKRNVQETAGTRIESEMVMKNAT